MTKSVESRESGPAAMADDGVVGSRRVLHVGRDRPIRISAGHRIRHHDGKCSLGPTDTTTRSQSPSQAT